MQFNGHARTVHVLINTLAFVCADFHSGLSKAETQALTNYGSGEDENEEEEMEEFEAGPVDVQTSLQASADGQVEQEVGVTVSHRHIFFPPINNHKLDYSTHFSGSDLCNCVMLQGATCSETQENKTEQRSSENDGETC